MKNLKKLLAVVLAVCMVFSLMAVASAKQITDYSDAASVQYKEAVDLNTGLGIMAGGGGTDFNPTGTFTREMAAKVICYILLGKTVSDSLTTATSSFTDVAATRWSAPYIEYCAAAGIINGAGDGKFNPDGMITGSGMAKLLLTAIGYGAKGEYTGASWEIQSLVKAQSLGILDTGVNYSAPATREQVAKYVFNVLTKATCNTATYSAVTGTYTVGAQTLGQITFSLNKITIAAPTLNNVASHYWKAFYTASTVSASYSDDNVLYTSTAGGYSTVKNLMTASSGIYKASPDSAVVVYYNGDALEAVATGTAVTGGAGTLYYNTTLGNVVTAPAGGVAAATDVAYAVVGATIKLIDNDYDGLVDTISIVEKALGSMTAVPTVDAAGVTTFNAVAYPAGTIVYPSGLAIGDKIVSVTISGVLYVEKLTKVQGTITAANVTYGTVTLGGTTYTKATYSAAGNFVDTTVAANFNIATTAYVDANGYMVASSTDVATSFNYGLLVGYSYVTDGLGSGSATCRIYLNDGTLGVYSVATGALGVVPNQELSPANVYNAVTNPSPVFNFVADAAPYDTAVNAYLVKYTIGTDGKITLTAGNAVTDVASVYNPYTSTIAVTGHTYYITSATKIFYFNGAAWSAANTAALKTGYLSANVGAAVGTDVTVATNAYYTSQLDAIYIMAAPVTTAGGNYAYLGSVAYSTRVVNGFAYYDFTAYVNGAATTITTMDETLFTGPGAGLYNITKDAYGNATTGTALATAGGVITFIDANYIAYGASSSVAVNSATQYYLVNAITGVVTASSAPALLSGTTTTMTFFSMNLAGTAAAQVYYTVA